ncbi:MAG: hypothetical protein QS748_04615 [Candidatus Endonucleobacter bathymodioli]|uniref:Uncharacterized protein n=1 Tax=Candidatus Endonucleibacter bathymodioli TaxID=539814 RepID=A0AA90SSI5_9GAMM|nr:hypothetical protein [Candidatus Endonucleobacter bathymodioli]
MNTEKVASAMAATTFDPALDKTKSLSHFSSEAYLQRGRILDNEVRKLAGQIELSNDYLSEINILLNEASDVLYGGDEFAATSWQNTVNGGDNSITLDDGYGLVVSANGSFTITDADGNSLAYAGAGLIPTPAGGPSGNSIILNGKTSIVLENGTKLTLDFTGPTLTSLVITRGNQGMSVTGLNGVPVVNGPALDGETRDAAITDGDILVENGGVNSLLQDGLNVDLYNATGGRISEEHKDFIKNQLKIEIDLSGNITKETWTQLKRELTLARDNLTGSNQLQTVLLQSALTRYNQNYDAMTNLENKIFALLKEILNRV